jgi:ADP-heptose:LPS heptosyltransferase
VGYISDDFHIADILYNIRVKKAGVKKHQILQCLDLLSAIGVPSERFVMDCSIKLPEEAEKRFAAFLNDNPPGADDEKLVVINISNNQPSSEWPAKNFIRLADGLAAANMRVIITSARAHRSRAGEIIGACGQATLYYETPDIMDFAAAVKKADLLICHDSGAMHIGAAASTRTLVLVGRGIIPGIWGPYGQGHKCLVKSDIAELPAEEVIGEALSMLKGCDE